MDFDLLLTLLKAADSLLHKRTVLINYTKESPESFALLQNIMRYCYDPNKLYHCTFSSHVVLPLGPGVPFVALAPRFFAALDACEECYSAKQNKATLQQLLDIATPGAQRLMTAIINKDLKAGLGEKTVLDMFPGLFVTFNCQLANTYDPEKDYKTSVWLVSTKLDGLRCVALRIGTSWELFTREGIRIQTCQHLYDAYEKLYRVFGYSFLDGELYAPGLDFEEIQSRVLSKTNPAAGQGLHHAVWSFGEAADFLAEKPARMRIFHGPEQSASLQRPTLWVRDNLSEFIWPVIQVAFPNDPEKIKNLTKQSVDAGAEGVMLRNPNVLYDFKRSDLLVKSKIMKTMDGVITAVETGTLTRKVADGGNEEYLGMKNATFRQENGQLCNVGSGWSVQQRIDAYNNPQDFIGKTIEVKYQNLTNSGKCRFPVFKCFRDDKTVR